MKWNDLKAEACPVARGLSVIGDRWTILVLRDAFYGVRRFDDFQSGLGITRHVLASRLRKLEDAGVLERKAYMERPPRYEYRLTAAGLELAPVLTALASWADTWNPHADGPSLEFYARDTGKAVTPVLVDEKSGAPLTSDRLRVRRTQ